jgi:hypothetical protein
MQRTLEILREWKIPLLILLAYYIVAALVIYFIHRRWCSKHRASNPRRYRFIFAAVLALVFTPSVVSDFFLFMLPGPAILGLLLLLPGTFMYPWPLLLVDLLYYILPMAAVFGIAHFVLLRLERHSDATPVV